MKSTKPSEGLHSVHEALANIASKAKELLKSLASHDYQTRGYIIISEDDPNFSRRVADLRDAIIFAEKILLKTK